MLYSKNIPKATISKYIVSNMHLIFNLIYTKVAIPILLLEKNKALKD